MLKQSILVISIMSVISGGVFAKTPVCPSAGEVINVLENVNKYTQAQASVYASKYQGWTLMMGQATYDIRGWTYTLGAAGKPLYHADAQIFTGFKQPLKNIKVANITSGMLHKFDLKKFEPYTCTYRFDVIVNNNDKLKNVNSGKKLTLSYNG